MSNPDNIIDVKNLTKAYDGRIVVDHINLQVKRGEIFGFLGPNGSGKTTTLRMLCGLLKPDAGEGTCLGFDIRTQADLIKLNVGYMTQHFSFYKDLSIYENLDFIAQVYQLDNRKQRIAQALDQLGFTGRDRQLTGDLSGGWQQRVALAACLLHQPELLLLDEPTAGVDPKARREFWDQISALSEQGITTLVTTHYMDEAARCTRLAYIVYSKLMAEGTEQDIIASVNLITWEISGPNIIQVKNNLQNAPGIQQVAMFGNDLHICGKDANLLNAALAPLQKTPDYHCQQIPTSLEDVFINFVDEIPDNFGGNSTMRAN
jgi:ABC-2 type transport system ATP-binding protein